MKQWFAANPTVRLDTTCPPRGRVLCFHGAGCDASLFVTKGSPAKPLPNPLLDFCQDNEIELLSFQLPGRGTRCGEPSCTEVVDAAESALNVLEPYLARSTPSQSLVGPVPLFVVGHSLGAWIAYEFACLMRKRQLPAPKQLVLACMVPPNISKEQRPWREVRGLDDCEFRVEMRNWGVNEDVFKPGVWEVFEPMLRRDLTLVDDYVFSEPRSGSSSNMSSQHSSGGSPLPPQSTTTTTTTSASLPPASEQQRGSPTTATTTSSSNGDSPTKRQSFHAPLGVDTLVVHASKDKRVTASHAQGWNRIIMGTNLFSSSPSGMGTAAKNGSEFCVHQVDGGHNFLYDAAPREEFFNAITEKLDRMLIDAEYGNC